MKHKFPYKWYLKDGYPAKGIEYHGSKVFSCFSCGGGSTMGYKLAGYDVIGCNEIDAKMMKAYKTNHNPQFSFLEPIQTFKTCRELPKELFNLDILDGSPPCSSFSMAGNREKDWGKEKKFREGQAEQVLDTLFFDFIDLAKRLQPKVVIAENVKGMLLGEAKQYVREVYTQFQEAGYQLRIRPYLLDASKMGVPQRRERVFFIAIRNDLSDQFMEQVDMFQVAPKLDLEFSESEIFWDEFETDDKIPTLTSKRALMLWSEIKPGQVFADHPDSNSGFGAYKLERNRALPTITSVFRPKSGTGLLHPDIPRILNCQEYCNGGSYPEDYNFNGQQYGYVIGMSVPPVMTAQISHQVYLQWISKL